MQRQSGRKPHHHRTCLHRNRIAAPSRAQPFRRKERDCRIRQQGSIFCEEDAEVPCHAPSATTNIRQQRNREHYQSTAMDGQRNRPRGTYLRHRRDGLHQQRQYAAQTACPNSLQDIRHRIQGLLSLLHRHQTQEKRKPHILPRQDAGETERENAAR